MRQCVTKWSKNHMSLIHFGHCIRGCNTDNEPNPIFSSYLILFDLTLNHLILCDGVIVYLVPVMCTTYVLEIAVLIFKNYINLSVCFLSSFPHIVYSNLEKFEAACLVYYRCVILNFSYYVNLTQTA